MQVVQRDQQASISQADASAGQPRRNANAHNANRRNRQQRGFANAGRTTPSTFREQGLAAKRRKVSHETGDAISTEEWNAGRAAGKCSCCGLAGHTYKKDNKIMCPILRNAAPHASITTAKANPNFNKQAWI